MTPILDLKVGIQQRVLPTYRAPFFEMLAVSCSKGLAVFAGQPPAEDMVEQAAGLKHALFFEAENHQSKIAGQVFFKQGGLIDWLENWQPDILVIEANPRNRSIAAAVNWMHARKRKVVGWGLGIPVDSGPFSALRSQLRNRLLFQLDGVITYSAAGADSYRRAGFPAEKVYVAPNAVAPRPTGPAPHRPAGLKNERATLLFVGRLQFRKKIDALLQACAELPTAIQPELVIIGDGPARAEWQRLAETIYPQAKFIGALHGHALEPYFKKADLFVLPGTGGLAIQQAMSFALPVIVGEADGTQADLVRQDNGWVIDSMQPGELSRILLLALSDPARIRQMGNESYRIVHDEINLEKMVEAFLQALQSIGEV
ncbi:MAG TPA: glycosyltransferase family 4 protein [Longilinea sp.]|nr:glycosyltransferase family 4 protein [Longilinea sp.]